MNYSNPEIRDRLAAEYVLGTLSGLARKRFDRLLMEDASLRHEVWIWESRLSPMAGVLQPQPPPQQVWENIQKRLGLVQERSRKIWQRLGFWQSWVAISTVSLVFIAMLFVMQSQVKVSMDPEYFALFEDAQDQPLWLLNIDQQSGELEIRAVAVNAQGDKSFELWLLPDSGQAPRSMGLLPVAGKQNSTLTKLITRELNKATGLAVSLEPRGGSTTGQPTGPVLYQTKVIKL